MEERSDAWIRKSIPITTNLKFTAHGPVRKETKRSVIRYPVTLRVTLINDIKSFPVDKHSAPVKVVTAKGTLTWWLSGVDGLSFRYRLVALFLSLVSSSILPTTPFKTLLGNLQQPRRIPLKLCMPSPSDFSHLPLYLSFAPPSIPSRPPPSSIQSIELNQPPYHPHHRLLGQIQRWVLDLPRERLVEHRSEPAD